MSGVKGGGRRYALVMTLAIAATVVVCAAGGAAVAALVVTTTTGTRAEAPHPASSPTADDPTTAPTPTPSEVPVEPPPPAPVEPPAPVVPVSPADTPCTANVTMSVWAHYDDDLLFMNPQLQDAMTAGDCVRTVFLTGADAGRGWGYAQGRELGILRAYNTMRGQTGFWSEKKVTLLSGMVASQWSPQDDPDITVTFLRLPDGNLTGRGFPSTGNVSLPALVSGAIATLTPTDGGPPASLAGLVASVGELITAYGADRLFTEVPAESAEWAPGDHPDHSATGTITRAAWRGVSYPPDLVKYVVGYPSLNLGPNVGGDALARKVAAFRVYAAEDPVVGCVTDAACLAKPRYGGWLERHYAKTEPELFPNG